VAINFIEWWGMYAVFLIPTAILLTIDLWVQKHYWEQGWPLACFILASLAIFAGVEFRLMGWHARWSEGLLEQLYQEPTTQPAQPAAPISYDPPGRFLQALSFTVVAVLIAGTVRRRKPRQ
jgi:hypothetical protein